MRCQIAYTVNGCETLSFHKLRETPVGEFDDGLALRLLC
jgi:hypothetical protein